MSARADIADAASTVAGLNVTPHYRQVTKSGDGFVRLGQLIAAENGFGFVAEWEVVVSIGQDSKATETWLDTNLAPLADALARELHITTVTPLELVFGSASTNAVVITGTREHE